MQLFMLSLVAFVMSFILIAALPPILAGIALAVLWGAVLVSIPALL